MQAEEEAPTQAAVVVAPLRAAAAAELGQPAAVALVQPAAVAEASAWIPAQTVSAVRAVRYRHAVQGYRQPCRCRHVAQSHRAVRDCPTVAAARYSSAHISIRRRR